MIFRESAFAFQRRHYGQLQVFGEFQQFISSFGVHHALAGHNDGALRRQQAAHAGGDGGGVRGGTHMYRRNVVKILLADFIGGEVLRYFQQHRPRLAGAQLGERLAH